MRTIIMSRLVVTAILLSVCINFMHYIDNTKNHRNEDAKYYYKRTAVTGVVFAALLFVVDAHFSSRSAKGGASAQYGGIQTGPPPF